MLDWLWARCIAAILYPVHMLAKKVIYSKIHSAIGISKVLFVISLFSSVYEPLSLCGNGVLSVFLHAVLSGRKEYLNLARELNPLRNGLSR